MPRHVEFRWNVRRNSMSWNMFPCYSICSLLFFTGTYQFKACSVTKNLTGNWVTYYVLEQFLGGSPNRTIKRPLWQVTERQTVVDGTIFCQWSLDHDTGSPPPVAMFLMNSLDPTEYCCQGCGRTMLPDWIIIVIVRINVCGWWVDGGHP